MGSKYPPQPSDAGTVHPQGQQQRGAYLIGLTMRQIRTLDSGSAPRSGGKKIGPRILSCPPFLSTPPNSYTSYSTRLVTGNRLSRCATPCCLFLLLHSKPLSSNRTQLFSRGQPQPDPDCALQWRLLRLHAVPRFAWPTARHQLEVCYASPAFLQRGCDALIRTADTR